MADRNLTAINSESFMMTAATVFCNLGNMVRNTGDEKTTSHRLSLCRAVLSGNFKPLICICCMSTQSATATQCEQTAASYLNFNIKKGYETIRTAM